ncbi:MAG: hypothetical protein QM767_02230 [Anaeromyxobacter sp.]
MSTAGWLIRRELRTRWRSAGLFGAVVAALAAAVTAMQLFSLAREDAVAAQVDAMGPALTVVPAGGTAGALATAELGLAGLPAATAERVEEALGSDVRRLELRLLFLADVGGHPTPVMGLEAWPSEAHAGAQVGVELVRRVGSSGPVRIAGEPGFIAGSRPASGSLEDVAVLLPLERALALPGAPSQSNVLRVYLRAGADPARAAARIGERVPGVTVVRHDLGAVAAVELPGSLARHRAMTLLLFALTGGLCLLIAAHLDAAERVLELATLVAIGAPRRLLGFVIVGRSLVIAAAGSTLGVGVGAAVVAAQTPGFAGMLASHPGPLASLVLAAPVLAILAAWPVAWCAAVRDPVPALQEG